MTPEQEALRDATRRLLLVIDMAGLVNLSNGVELGQTSWYVKASDAVEHVERALAALDGEGEGEEWEYYFDNRFGPCVRESGGRIVATASSETDARQIAADHNTRSKLERAAREVLAQWFGNCGDVYRGFDRHSDYSRYTEALRDLRAALNDEVTS